MPEYTQAATRDIALLGLEDRYNYLLETLRGYAETNLALVDAVLAKLNRSSSYSYFINLVNAPKTDTILIELHGVLRKVFREIPDENMAKGTPLSEDELELLSKLQTFFTQLINYPRVYQLVFNHGIRGLFEQFSSEPESRLVIGSEDAGVCEKLIVTCRDRYNRKTHPMRLLELLAAPDRFGKVVSLDEMTELLWDKQYYEIAPQNLTQLIIRLRRILEEATFILGIPYRLENVRGKGYRIIVEEEQ
jgi:hypothetical protein